MHTEQPTRKKSIILICVGALVIVALIAIGAFIVFGTGSHVQSNDSNNTDMQSRDKEIQYVDISSLSASNGELTIAGFSNSASEKFTQLKQALNAYSQKISLVVYSADGMRALAYNTDATFFSACTIKAPYVYYLCQELEKGNGSLTDTITYTSSFYHQGSGVIKDQGEGTSYTIAELMDYLLRISDNSAYEMLRSKYSGENFNAFVESQGWNSLTTSGLWGKSVQAKDYVAAWKAIYDYFATGTEIANTFKTACSNTPFAYGVLFNTHLEYSHKSGDNYSPLPAYNDAGIIWDESGQGKSYIFAVFTTDDGDGGCASQENEIMQLCYEIMTSIN